MNNPSLGEWLLSHGVDFDEENRAGESAKSLATNLELTNFLDMMVAAQKERDAKEEQKQLSINFSPFFLFLSLFFHFFSKKNT